MVDSSTDYFADIVACRERKRPGEPTPRVINVTPDLLQSRHSLRGSECPLWAPQADIAEAAIGSVELIVQADAALWQFVSSGAVSRVTFQQWLRARQEEAHK
jgi:hypothetical protein